MERTQVEMTMKVNMDETKIYEDCNDDTDKESCYTQEEEQEREDKSNENKDKENHLRRKEIEDRNKNGGLQRAVYSHGVTIV